MRIGPLLMFVRGTFGTDKARHYVIAAWHWRWSITWSWTLWWWPPWALGPTPKPHERLIGAFLFHKQRTMPRAKLAQLSAEAKASREPLPPEDLIDAKHDHVHREHGQARAAFTVKNKRDALGEGE